MNLLYEDMHDTTYDDLQMHTKHDLGGTSSPKANIRGTDLRPALIDAIVHDST